MNICPSAQGPEDLGPGPGGRGGNNKSNVDLQNAFSKYGLDKFKFCIYEYFTYESKIISHQALTDLETSYINRFNFDNLYNF